MNLEPFRLIGIPREGRSPENPSERSNETDQRIALAPTEIRELTARGCKVFVERGAGEGIGFSAADFEAAGATIQNERELYKGKDLLVKLKGPSLDGIEMMSAGSAILCFAHVESFPARKQLFIEHGINVLAMEEVLEHPERVQYTKVLGKAAIKRALASLQYERGKVDITIVGFSEGSMGAVQQAVRSGANVTVVQPDVRVEEMPDGKLPSILFFDSRIAQPPHSAVEKARINGAVILDLAFFEPTQGLEAVDRYLSEHPPKEFGKRRVEFLHETGICGTRYGFTLSNLVNEDHRAPADLSVLIMGCGNVALGGLDEAYKQGARSIRVLGRTQLQHGVVEPYLANADLIINGVDLPDAMRGKHYIITREHTANVIKSGTVVIDLVGGSKTERSAIENIQSCTYLNNPHFEEHGIWFSAIWGWPMLGMMKESALNYSRQILDILVGQERIIDGLRNLPPGADRAWMIRVPQQFTLPIESERPAVLEPPPSRSASPIVA